MFRKSFSIVVLIAFLFSSINPLYAGSLFSNLSAPGTFVHLSSAFKPVMIQGIKLDPKNPLHLDFIIDTGDALPDGPTVKAETLKLVRYFLASLTVPNDQLWVNLSPYEKNRIIPDGLALTEMGGELLAQDYMLKQLTASLMGPDQAAGKQFWSRIYSKANEKYGSTKIPLDIFNKVWIVPDQATIYEHHGTAVIVQSHLKVMLEQDYLSLEKHLNQKDSSIDHQEMKTTGSMASALIREVVLPQIEQDVNTGSNFAGVRQVNNALILAAWFKQNLKQSLLGQEYANQNKVSGIDLQDRMVKQKIYSQYLRAFKKGIYNYIKEDYDPRTQETVARKYFVGGYNATSLRLRTRTVTPAQMSASMDGRHELLATINLAMLTDDEEAALRASDERLDEIKASQYQGFPVVRPDRDIPVGIQYALAFYDHILGAGYNPLRELIRKGDLRAGYDVKLAIKAKRDGDSVIVSLDSENEVDQVTVELLSGKAVRSEFNEWKKKYNGKKRIETLAYHNSGVIVKPMEVLMRYGILDLLGKGKPVKMREIVEHVQGLTVDGKIIQYNKPNTQYIFAVLASLESLGWLTSKGRSASNNREFTLTAQGLEAIKYADRYAQVADFMPEFTKIEDYLFNRPNAPPLKGALTLRQLVEESERGWDIPSTEDPNLAKLIRGQLDGYLVINLSLALWEDEKGGVFNYFNDEGIINIDDIVREKGIVGNHDELNAAFDVFVNVGFLNKIAEGKYQKTTEGLVAFDKVLNYGVPVSYRPTYDLVEEFMFGDVEAIKRYENGRELLVYRWLNVLGSGASHAPYFKQIDKILQTTIAERLENEQIPPPEELTPENPFVLAFADTGSGDGTFLEHVYHVLMKTGYLQRMKDHEDLYKIQMVGVDYNQDSLRLTSERLHAAGVPHAVMFGDIGDPQQIVRDVKMSLLSKFGKHEPIQRSQFWTGAALEQLFAKGILEEVPGDATSVRVRADVDIAVKDIREITQSQNDFNKIWSILQNSMHAHTMVFHTRTFLDHNRPWVGVKDVLMARRRVSNSTGTYGWRGVAIPNNFFEQNLFEHFKAWADALRAEGQTDLLNIELHTIPPQVAVARIGQTLTFAYDLAHRLSDQFTTENSVYQARAKEAGFVGISHKLIPDEFATTVSIDHWGIPAAAAAASPAMIKPMQEEKVDPSSPFGGINLNPDLGFVRVEQDGRGDEASLSIATLKDIDIKGIQPILVRIVPLSPRRLLEE